MSGVNLTIPILKTHTMRVLAVHPCMSTKRAVATQTNAIAVVNGVILLTTPHTLLGVTSAFFGNMVTDRGTDLLDPCSREGGGNVEGGVDVMLKASEGVSPSEVG